MIATCILNSCIRTARRLVHLPDGKSLHFAFLLDGRNVVGFGYNQHRTHPYRAMFPAPEPTRPAWIHAEAAAIFSTRKIGDSVIVLRINRAGQLRYSRPCGCCQNLLTFHNITRVYYSAGVGDLFIEERL